MRINYGAGGFAIFPSLFLRGMVVKNSPAFDVLLSNRWNPVSPRSAEISALMLQGTIEKLSCLFAEGKSSPGDVDGGGNTLLHVRVCLSHLERCLIIPFKIGVSQYAALRSSLV